MLTTIDKVSTFKDHKEKEPKELKEIIWKNEIKTNDEINE